MRRGLSLISSSLFLQFHLGLRSIQLFFWLGKSLLFLSAMLVYSIPISLLCWLEKCTALAVCLVDRAHHFVYFVGKDHYGMVLINLDMPTFPEATPIP